MSRPALVLCVGPGLRVAGSPCAYVPGGLASPRGGLGPGQAGRGWGRGTGQGCRPQALTAQALQRGRGRWQSGGSTVFLPGEEPGSGSHCPHTMGPVGTVGQGPRLVEPDPDLNPDPGPPHTLDPHPCQTLARPREGCSFVRLGNWEGPGRGVLLVSPTGRVTVHHGCRDSAGALADCWVA